jgi:hypothetical protein
MKNRKMIRLLAAALTLAMAVSLLAMPVSAAQAQTTAATQSESNATLKTKAAMGALGMGAMVYFYWHPTARQKASNVAQLVLSDAVSDVLLFLGDVAAEARSSINGTATDAKAEKSRVNEQHTAKENEETVQTVQDTQASKNTQSAQVTQTTKTLTTETQSAADEKTATTADAKDADEPAQVIVKLGSAYAAKPEN